MKLLVNIPLKFRLSGLFLAVGLIPMLTMAWFAHDHAAAALKVDTFAHLESVRQIHKTQIEAYFEGVGNDISILAGNSEVVAALQVFRKAFDTAGKRIGGDVYDGAVARFGSWFAQNKHARGYYDLLLISRVGDVVYSVAREDDLGENLIQGHLQTSGLGRVFAGVSDGIAIDDFESYGPSNNEQTAFIAAPIKHAGDMIGVVVLQLHAKPIDAIINERAGMGDTGEFYLVGNVRGTLAYRSNRTIKDGKIGDKRTDAYIEEALSGKSGTAIKIGSTGKPELVSFAPLAIRGLNWALVGTISIAEIEGRINKLFWTTLFLALGFAILVVMVAVFTAVGIANPLLTLMIATRAIAAGNLAARAEVADNREIGQLADTFNQMAQQIEDQDWLKANAMAATDVVQQATNPAELAQTLISQIAQLLQCGCGLFYIRDATTARYHRMGSFRYQHSEHRNDSYAASEGLIGQCALDCTMMTLDTIPDDYIKIHSSLGEASPDTIVAIPLVFQGQALGVIELATFQSLTPIQNKFLQELINSVGIGLANLLRSHQTEVLLGETQAQADQLGLQREELQQANVELKNTGEELITQQQELQQTNAELVAKNQHIQRQTKELELAHQQTEAKAEEATRVSAYKSQFLANMSHELRTPLNSLLILAKMFADNTPGNLTREQVDSAQIIYESGIDLLNLINNILDLAKLEVGKNDLHISIVAIAHLSATIERQFQHVAQQEGLAWAVEVANDLPERIRTDEGKVLQIVKNFLSNAFKFTERGYVNVRLQVASPHLRAHECRLTPPLAMRSGLAISVIDTGIGIAQDRWQAVFEVFQQGDASSQRKYGGTGLGLSISLELAKLLRGEVRIMSTPEQGSCFTLCLPLDLAAMDEIDEIDEMDAVGAVGLFPQSTGSSCADDISVSIQQKAWVDDRDIITPDDCVVLVVENDKAFARILYNLSQEEGFKTLIADSGEDGIILANKYQPMAIILDRALPDTDGEMLIAQLNDNARTRQIPIHLISASTWMPEGQLAPEGIVGVLSKPVSEDQLKAVLEQIKCAPDAAEKELLLVEDDPVSHQFAIGVLTRVCSRITSVTSGEEAYRLLQERTFICMILDLGLPGINGFDLLDKINQNTMISNPRTIIYTARDLTKEEYLRLRSYTDTVIIKGVDSTERLQDEVVLFLQKEVRKPAGKQSEKISPSEKGKLFDDNTVLIVDDDVRNAFALSKALQYMGLNVMIAQDGKQALKLLANESSIEVVLMDIMMPEMDGYQVIEKIREQPYGEKLPIIALSAMAMAEESVKNQHAGADEFLPKPVDMPSLVALIRACLQSDRSS